MKRSTSVLVFMLAVAAVAVLSIVVAGVVLAATHDMLATFMLEEKMSGWGLTCDDDLDVDLKIASWQLIIQPTLCTTVSKTSPIVLKTTSKTTVKLRGFQAESTKTSEIVVNVQRKHASKDSGVFDTLGIEKTADALAIAAAQLAQKSLPKVEVDRVVVEVNGKVEANLSKLKLAPGSPTQITLKKAELATRKRDGTVAPRDAWLSITAIDAEVTSKRVHVVGKPVIKTRFTGDVRIPVKASATATGLHTKKPRWKLDLDMPW